MLARPATYNSFHTHMPSSVVGGGLAHSVSSSSIVAQPVKGSHVLKIDGYSRFQGGGDKFITSDTFDVGGSSWVIRYYPNGNGDSPRASGWLGFFLHLNHNPGKGVEASWEFSLLSRVVGVPSMRSGKDTSTFRYGGEAWGVPKFIRRSAMAGSAYLMDDCFQVRCDITVWTAVRTGSIPRVVTVPPSDMHQHIGRLLQSQVGTDVTFQVGAENFAAHRALLTARSPVFMAQLFGQMKETMTSQVWIDDMEPIVLRAMLRFVYTDSLPEMDSGGDAQAMAQHLLVAAGKYGMERLKLICEDRLCDYINTGTAATTLELAEQYGFRGLKQACFKFLKTSGNLKAIMDSDEFRRLTTRCPSLLSELLANVAL